MLIVAPSLQCIQPVLNLLDQPISKRQGQNWGQEKTAKKQKGKGRIKESADDASFDANACSDGERTYNGDLDKLPSLPNAPQVVILSVDYIQ